MKRIDIRLAPFTREIVAAGSPEGLSGTIIPTIVILNQQNATAQHRVVLQLFHIMAWKISESLL